jgi:predicted O-methyltransferase YrrM
MTPDLEVIERSYTDAPLNVEGPNRKTVDFFASTDCRVYGELGVYLGGTAQQIAAHLGGEGAIHLFDFEDRVRPVAEHLTKLGHRNVFAHANTRKVFDSYNWSLMKLLRDGAAGSFDYVFIDGAHTWALDALAFLLVDRLLADGGYVDFDDYGWTLARSPSMSPEAFPPTSRLYTDEQINERQVALIVDVLVRSDDRYEEVVENKIFRKRGACA